MPCQPPWWCAAACVAVLSTCGASGQPADNAAAPARASPVSVTDLPASPPCTGEVTPTPRRSDGGHYRPGAPTRDSLVEPGMPGRRLVLRGYVLFPDCRPVGGAVLDAWSADTSGEYDDEGWRLRGVFRTDEHGRYSIETIVPGSEPGRAPTVHVKASENFGGRVLTTQAFLAGQQADTTHPSVPAELVATTIQGPEGVVARFDIVIEPG